MTVIEQALQCLLLIMLFSTVILGAAGVYSWIVSLFDMDDRLELELEEDEI